MSPDDWVDVTHDVHMANGEVYGVDAATATELERIWQQLTIRPIVDAVTSDGSPARITSACLVAIVPRQVQSS